MWDAVLLWSPRLAMQNTQVAKCSTCVHVSVPEPPSLRVLCVLPPWVNKGHCLEVNRKFQRTCCPLPHALLLLIPSPQKQSHLCFSPGYVPQQNASLPQPLRVSHLQTLLPSLLPHLRWLLGREDGAFLSISPFQRHFSTFFHFCKVRRLFQLSTSILVGGFSFTRPSNQHFSPANKFGCKESKRAQTKEMA